MIPKRRFGQNFLVDRSVIDRIIASVNPQADETIIEIGPGRGALTSRLVETGARVLAIELDRELVPDLRAQFSENLNFSVSEADALTANYCELIEPAATARVVANLPYTVGTAISKKRTKKRTC